MQPARRRPWEEKNPEKDAGAKSDGQATDPFPAVFRHVILKGAMELVFEATQETDGGYVAECLSEDVVTQGDTWEELRTNVREAVEAYFFDKPVKPLRIRLHLVKDEVLSCG